MNHEATPPPDWYPDPEVYGQLRYWDGSAWTHHVAQVPPAAPQPEPQYVAQAARAAGPRAWTRGTIITLLVCITLVVGAASGAVGLYHYETEAHERQAARALEGFLEHSTRGERQWRDFANQKLLDAVTVGSPILGDTTTADALDLTVSYEVGPLIFHSDLPLLPPDLASAKLKLSYSYTLQGQQVTSTAWQDIWLSRPFYYGDDVPARASDDTPTAVGPWRVTSMTLPSSEGDGSGEGNSFFETNLQVPNLEGADDTYCFDAPQLLEDVSTSARTTNEVRSHCFLNDGEIEVGENVDLDDLAMSFPPIDALNPSYLPSELIRLDPGMANNSVPPLRQYLIRGQNGNYVMTVALVETTGGDDEWSASNRIVSIQLIEEGEA